MTSAANGQQWVPPAVVRGALSLSDDTLRRLRQQGRLIEGRDYLRVTPTCLRYDLAAVRQTLASEVA